jgi:hypothetical protein
MGNEEAMESFQPHMVFASWMSMGNDWTAMMRNTPSVQEYILIGELGTTRILPCRQAATALFCIIGLVLQKKHLDFCLFLLIICRRDRVWVKWRSRANMGYPTEDGII